MNGRFPRRPEEGWLPPLLVVFLALTLAWAMDDPAWVNGKGALTDSLPVCALLGVAVGFGGPKLGWGRWTTHAVGALFAGLLIPVLAGWAMSPGAPIGEAFRIAATGSVDAYLDIAWRGRQFTNQEIHYIVVLGAVVWGTAQFAAYAVFGHRRPLNAVLVAGLVLIGNMALTSLDQLPRLVAFTGASLFLLIAMHAFDERATWIRRQIGEPGAIAGLYLRGGTVFIAVALLGSMVLTQRAASSPLAGAWAGVDDQLFAIGRTFGRLFPVGGDVRGVGGVTFGTTARIADQWVSDDNVAFEATVPVGSPPVYWRAATYDAFELRGWEQTGQASVPVPAGQPLLAGSAEDPPSALTTGETVVVRPEGYHDRLVLSPGTPVSLSLDSTVLLGGQAGWFGGVEVPGNSPPYTVESAVLRLGDTDAVSQNRLRAASTDYPAEITARYAAVPAGAIGPAASSLLTEILQTVKPTNAYDTATAIRDWLLDGSKFTYTTDLRGVTCSDPSAVECFALTHKGYCLNYASTMAILLRAANPSNPIPTRLVQGFLPGTRSGTLETVRNRQAHAWVEVYFAGYGWIPFDPTGGGVGLPSQLRQGPPVASPTAAPQGSSNNAPVPTRRLPRDGGAQGGVIPPPTSGPGDRTLMILLTGLLAFVVVGAAIAAWLRGPRGEVSPDRAWLTLSRRASRLGFAPRPTQTIYEYADALGELVPVAQPDLRTVADAKVETTYARTSLGGDRLHAVRAASRRLRLSLLRLVLRRGQRSRRPPR